MPQLSAAAFAHSLIVASAGASVLYASSALADPPNLLARGVTLGLGTYVVNTDTKVRVDGETVGEVVPGTEVDWEQTFGGGDVNRFRGDGQWRFAERHKLRLMAFDWSRDSTRQIDEEIVWDGETFEVDATISGEREFSVYEAAYEYAFLRRERYEVAATIGIHWTSFEVSLAEVGGGGSVGSEASTDAPLPVLGLRGTWNLGRSFWLDTTAQYFALSIDEFDGSLLNIRAALLWQPRTWFGLGLGYDYFGVDVEIDSDSFTGKADWAYDGPQVFYNVSF